MTTQPTSVWDDPELKAGGEFVKFDAPGDTIAGTITAVRRHRFDDGSVAPQILLTTDDGEERTITAGQVRLKSELAEKRPEAGDHIKVTLSQIEKRSGGKTLKHFDVEVTPGGVQPSYSTAATTAPAPVTSPATPPDPADVMAALANLTPEARQTLGLA